MVKLFKFHPLAPTQVGQGRSAAICALLCGSTCLPACHEVACRSIACLARECLSVRLPMLVCCCQRACLFLAPWQEVFTFEHPNRAERIDNTRSVRLEFECTPPGGTGKLP